LDRLGLLIQACLQTDDVARVIIQNRQWITPLAISGVKPSLKIHLPKFIGSFVFEPLPSLVFLRLRAIDLPVPL